MRWDYGCNLILIPNRKLRRPQVFSLRATMLVSYSNDAERKNGVDQIFEVQPPSRHFWKSFRMWKISGTDGWRGRQSELTISRQYHNRTPSVK